jgi:Tol biopolymer transport system component/tRNA A-37 threonylcarbamoyl transferase component Bud32
MSLVGHTIGRYRITEQLGEGGMGVVYRAQDSTLGRDVAIKVLRPELGRHPERLRRFSQEARAASALNHPNIITVHDAGEFEDGPFLVMELVEGESLRGILRRGPLALPKVLDIGIQAATALTRAHEGGITHRDLKPENILVRPDGYVKILDFGLAKLKEREPSAEATTLDAGLTSEGSIVGTAAYMSPEQATGSPVDGRSDIFSLALVLFEGWQGRHPFARANALDTLHAIAHDRLPALAHAAGSPEWGLARILEKALEKEPDERYQTMKDLGIDLRRLKEDRGQESGVRIHGGAARARRRPVLYAVGGLVALALLVAGGLFLFRSRRAAEPARLEYTQLTNFADSAVAPALSPDGRMLAFIRGESPSPGPGEIYVKLLPDGEPVQLTRDGSTKVGPTVFSPDGSRIAYTAGPSMYSSDTWIVPVLGSGPSRMLASASGMTWAGGGTGPRRILFSEMTGQGIHMGIFTSLENRSEQRQVYLPAEASGMAHRSFLSPDQKSVVVVEMDAGGWLPCRLVPYDGSSLGEPVGPSPAQCTDAAWSPDGKWMYFSTNAGNGFHIWRQRFPEGEPEQVTSGATEEQGLAFASDGRSFVTSVGASQSTLWVHDARGDRQITSQGYAYLPSFSADGKRLYYLVRSRPNRRFVSGDLWVASLETGQRERLLPDFLIEHYSVSADGNRVVLVGIDDAGHSPVWLATLDGRSAPRRLASLEAQRALFGANGDVFFVGKEAEGGRRFLYRIREDGSGLQKVVPDAVVFLYDVSPDGKWLAAWTGTSVVVYPAGGGSPTVVCTSCGSAGGENRAVTPPLVSWSRDGNFLYAYGRTGSRVYALPLRPGQILPPLPASGLGSLDDAAALPGARLIPQPRAFMGANPAVYAFPRVTTHRNIYRIPVP